MRRVRLLGVLLALLLLALPAVALAADDVESITKELLCQCNCTMMVNVCDCGTAEQMRQLVREKLASGQTGKQILDYFVTQYGEKVLGSPKKEGFNLTAYITPFAAIMVGGGGISAAALAWARRGRAASVVASQPSAANDDLGRYAGELEEDLAQLESKEDGARWSN
ncbi:MAG: cytochrome c-type biogenesis protein [Chloroflexota bacterium]